jgi:hypothetical protein
MQKISDTECKFENIRENKRVVVSKYLFAACKRVFRAFAKGNLIPLRANSMRNTLTASNIDNVSHKPIGEPNFMFKIWN